MIEKDGAAPYTSTAALLEVIDAFRHRSPRTPVTQEVLELLGLSQSIIPRTLQALKLLGLIDDDGEPTEALTGLKEAPMEEFPSRLAEVVRAAYADIFAHRNPASDPPEKIVDAFRMYGPASMRPRMVRLFYGLCKEAGLINEIPAVENAPAGMRIPRSARPRKSEVSPPRDAGGSPPRTTEPPIAPVVPPAQAAPRHLHPALVGLLGLVPPAEQPWPSAERFQTFKAAWDAALLACNPLPSDEGARGASR